MIQIKYQNQILIFRQAYYNDLETIVDIGRKTFSETYYYHFKNDYTLTALDSYLDCAFSFPQIQSEYMDPKTKFYLLKHGLTTVGYCKIVGIDIFPDMDDESILILERIYLDVSLQRSGIGRQIMDFVIQLAKENRKKAIRLHCWKDHQKSLVFYRECGFEIIGKTTFKIQGTDFMDTDFILEKAVG